MAAGNEWSKGAESLSGYFFFFVGGAETFWRELFFAYLFSLLSIGEGAYRERKRGRVFFARMSA